MKKIISPILITLIAGFANTLVLADPITHIVDYICPAPGVLSNFGNYISGFGSEILSRSTTNTIYFQSKQYLPGVPSSLVNYNNSATSYDAPSGYVTCSYISSNPSENSFDVSYNITNGKGGRILSRTNNTINVLFLVGVR